MKYALLILSLFLLAGCATEPLTKTQRDTLVDESEVTLNSMQREQPLLGEIIDRSYAYAVFPRVEKGGLIAGGSYGRGVVYEDGRMTGYADLSQATVGGQIGAQTYSELVVFEDQYALDRFKTGKLTLETNLSAVAMDRAAVQRAQYRNGVMGFVKPQGGLMAEATIGGQQFTFLPMDSVDR